MSSNSILGQFVYEEEKHGWALDCGIRLAHYDLISSSPLCSQSFQQEMSQLINALASRGGMTSTLDVPTESQDHQKQRVQFIDNLRHQMGIDATAALFIGMTSYYLRIGKTVSLHDNETTLMGLAENGIAELSTFCPELQIDTNALFTEMISTACDGMSIRSLLKSFKQGVNYE